MQDDTTTRLEAVSVDETKLKAHVDEVVILLPTASAGPSGTSGRRGERTPGPGCV